MAGNSKDSKILAYKDMINQLNKTISAQTELIQSLQKTLEADRLEKETLRQQIEYLTKKLFGTSSEKRKDIDGQLNLFDEAEQEADPTWKQELPDDITVPEHKRKARRTHADLFKNIPSCDEIISLPEEERNCPTCGTQMECIGKEFVRHEFRFTPAKGKVVNIYRETYKCPECARSEEHPDDQTFVKAPVQEPLIPESYASESVVAWAMHQKYQNGLPLKRQEEDWKQLGVPLSRATLANWIIYCAENYLCHVYDYFHRQLLKRKYLMADETPLQVLHEPERRAQTKSYMWLFRSGEDGGPPIILYKYSETRAGDNAVDFLHGFKGYLMCDGYSGYNKVPDAKRTACWAHIRRYLTDAIPKGKALDYTQPSVQGMLYINQLFHLEDVIRSKCSSFDAIKKARLEKEKPVVEGFLSWLDQQSPIRGSRMDKAVTYIQNRRSYLSTYLEDGRCSFSNNLSENAIRPFTVGRKNWLFCDTPNGAQASAIVYTMVEMAKANGVNVYHYLTYLLEKLPDDRMSDDELELLAPWNETVKAEIERRANESNQSYVNCQGAPATEK